MRDVAIIGGGDVGSAVARELARYRLDVVLFEAGDIGGGTSKANTAILHTGFDAKPGTSEAQLVARGHDLLLSYAESVGIPVERTGALLVAWTPEEMARLPEIERSAEACGYTRARPVSSDELYRREPHLGPGALAALEIPDEYIVCPWTPPLACALQAHRAGVEIRRFEAVDGLAPRPGGGWTLETARGATEARWVINAAGLASDVIHRRAGYEGFTITPRRGELIVFDKLSRPLVNHVLLPVPTGRTKGMLIAPTVFGNVMLGPTADDVPDPRATGSTRDGLDRLLAQGRRLMPELLEHEVTAVYAGLRAATEHSDYQLVVDEPRGYVCAGGIRSTGLTSALAIAEWVGQSLAAAGAELRDADGTLPPISMPNIGQAGPRPYEQAERIAADPAYGEIVCFCERVSRGEIRDALGGPLAAEDLDGLRRRTRALMGRCQGFFCGARVAAELTDGRRAAEVLG